MKLRYIDFRKSKDIYNDPNRGKIFNPFDLIAVVCPICKQPMWASKKDTKLYACNECYEKHLQRLKEVNKE